MDYCLAFQWLQAAKKIVLSQNLYKSFKVVDKNSQKKKKKLRKYEHALKKKKLSLQKMAISLKKVEFHLLKNI